MPDRIIIGSVTALTSPLATSVFEVRDAIRIAIPANAKIPARKTTMNAGMLPDILVPKYR